MANWLKLLMGGICIITILLHLLPEGKFTKYVKFYAGLLFCLMVLKPVLNFFAGDGEFERLLSLELLKEKYYELETSIEGIEELKNHEIMEAYRAELTRQIRELGNSYQIEISEIDTYFDEKDEYQLKGIELSVKEGTEDTKIEELKKEISQLYLVERKDILVTKGRRKG